MIRLNVTEGSQFNDICTLGAGSNALLKPSGHAVIKSCQLEPSAGTTRPEHALESDRNTTRQQLQLPPSYPHSPLNTLAPAETHTQNERRRPQSSILRHPRPLARHPPPGLRRHLWRCPPGREAAGCQRREEGC